MWSDKPVSSSENTTTLILKVSAFGQDLSWGKTEVMIQMYRIVKRSPESTVKRPKWILSFNSVEIKQKQQAAQQKQSLAACSHLSSNENAKDKKV